MKTVLRGIYLTDYLTFKTFMAKTVSPHSIPLWNGMSSSDISKFVVYLSQVALVTAAGSSLPIGKEVCTYLINPLITKFLTSFILSFINPLTPQGPFVHISSIIAHIMSKFVTTINRLYAV